MMTTEHAPTIQDASVPFWKLAGSDMFLVANPEGKIFGFHVRKPGLDPGVAEVNLKHSLERGEDAAWWYDAGQLYWVFLRPINAGAEGDAKQLGIIVVGEQVDSTLAQQLAVVAGRQIVLAAGKDVIAPSLSPAEETELEALFTSGSGSDTSLPREISVRSGEYQTASVLFHDGPPAPVSCYVLVSMSQAKRSIQQLNRTIFVLGLSAIAFGALLLSFVSRTITRPLDNLVAGVRALAAGDYGYAITRAGAAKSWKSARHSRKCAVSSWLRNSVGSPTSGPQLWVERQVRFRMICDTIWPLSSRTRSSCMRPINCTSTRTKFVVRSKPLPIRCSIFLTHCEN
jgi:HAMP domain-containing protein